MDIKIEKKPWYIRYRYYMIAALAFIIFLIYVISLSLGPRKLRIETDNIQIAEVKDDKFMEYVDVEGLVQPILTIKVNTREGGSVDRIVGEEGNMMKQGDTLLILTNPDLSRSIEDPFQARRFHKVCAYLQSVFAGYVSGILVGWR